MDAAGAQDGSSWANRYGGVTGLNDAEDTPVAAGDIVQVGPGAYRMTLTCDVSGGNTYSANTVNVVKASTTVTGVGTAFLANVAADYYFHVRLYASGNDGVTNGDNTFTSAAGNFQAGMIGCPIQINTKGAYVVATIVAANSITISDPNGLGWPADGGGGLTYSVMSGEGHYQIETVVNNTTITLKQPWQGRTLTGLSYLTLNAITYIADVTGENTDSVGGIVRITGSDNDQTAARADCITSSRSYRMFRGFYLDTGSGDGFELNGATHHIIEDCNIMHFAAAGIYIFGASQLCHTLRRCKIFGIKAYGLRFYHSGTLDDSGHVVENCEIVGSQDRGIRIERTGGVTFRNIFLAGVVDGIFVSAALTAGQTIYVTNSIFTALDEALRALTLGEITENFNNLFANGADRNTVATGASSVAYTPILLPSILHAGEDQLSGFRFPPPLLGELSEWSQIAAITGVDERNTDLLGIRRPNHTAAKNSWGALQFADMERETGTVHAGSVSIAIHDAGVHQIWVPVEASSTTFEVYVYREVNYAGTNPRLVIKQPGQADDVTTDANPAVQWNLLTTTLVPAAIPPYVIVELQSHNTNGANSRVFFDDLDVS